MKGFERGLIWIIVLGLAVAVGSLWVKVMGPIRLPFPTPGPGAGGGGTGRPMPM